jgi:hypothetical protein
MRRLRSYDEDASVLIPKTWLMALYKIQLKNVCKVQSIEVPKLFAIHRREN